MKFVDKNDMPGVVYIRLKSLDSLRIFLFFLLGFLTLGIFWIFTYWFQDLYFLLYRNEEDVWKADYIFFKRKDNSRFLIKIERKKCKINPCKETTFYMFFEFLGQLYYFDVNINKFIPIKNEMLKLIENNKLDKDSILQGLDKQIVNDLQKFYGWNQMQFQIKTFWQQFFFETLDPFNTIQIIFGILFMFFHRVLYSIMILVFVLITIYQSTMEYVKKMKKLKNMTDINSMMIVQRRINKEQFQYEIETQKLVVGDIVELQKDQIFPCDLVVIQGSCLVNEALLTGESIPILKTAYEFNNKKIKDKSKLMSGTKLVHKKSEHVYAVVVGTGWNTAKGLLIGSVVFQQKAEDKFRGDFMKVLFLFNIINIAIMILFILQNYHKQYFGFYWIAPYLLDIAKNCFHPTLFFIMAFCIQISSEKLRKKQIYSLKTNKIVEAGAVKQICFDKTGTLTKLDINIYGFILNSGNEFDSLGKDIYQFQHNKNFENFVQGLLTCHQLEQIEDQNVGDPLEEIILDHLDAKLQVINHPYNEDVKTNSILLTKFLNKCLKMEKNARFIQLHTLEFTSIRKRMSVVSLNQQNNETRVFCKGAPEIIKTLCKQESIPENYDMILKDFSEQGYRILSMAQKKVDFYQFNMNDQQNNELEQDLEFLGFLLFENPLKETTQKTINELQDNQYELAMITGDNIYTAINVGYQSGIIQQSKSVYQGILKNGKIQWTFQDQELHYNFENSLSQTLSINQSQQTSIIRTQTHDNQSIQNIIRGCLLEGNCLALTGDAFQKIVQDYKDNDQLINDILILTKIYARSSAPQKELIIIKYKKYYNNFDKYVAFIGDGSNDSLALKTANVGLSIGNNDSSFSAAFFTSDEQISNIIEIIIEGKACLGSAIQNFTYLIVILLSNTFIYYLFSINNWNAVNFDYIAGVLFSMPQAISMQYSKTNNKLTPLTPPRTLLTYKSLMKIIIQLISLLVVYLTIFLYLTFNELTKDYNDITSEAQSQYMQHSDYFFIESKFIFALYPFAILSQSWIAYQGLPFKKSYGQNIHLVILFFIDIIAFIFFIFPDILFDDYPNMMYYIKYYTRFPEFNDLQRFKFMLLYTVLILIQAFSVQIYIDLDLKDEVLQIQRDPEKFKEKQSNVLVKLDQLILYLKLIKKLNFVFRQNSKKKNI